MIQWRLLLSELCVGRFARLASYYKVLYTSDVPLITDMKYITDMVPFGLKPLALVFWNHILSIYGRCYPIFWVGKRTPEGTGTGLKVTRHERDEGGRYIEALQDICSTLHPKYRSGVTSIDLSNLALTSTDLSTFIPILELFPNLTWVNLADNMLHVGGPYEVLPRLLDIPSIKYVDVTGNKLDRHLGPKLIWLTERELNARESREACSCDSHEAYYYYGAHPWVDGVYTTPDMTPLQKVYGYLRRYVGHYIGR